MRCQPASSPFASFVAVPTQHKFARGEEITHRAAKHRITCAGVERDRTLPRFALCLTGRSKTIGFQDHREHLRAAIFQPLCAAAATDAYIQLEEGASGATAAANALVSGVTTQHRVKLWHDHIREPTNGHVLRDRSSANTERTAQPCASAAGSSHCWCRGYEQALKFNGCLSDLVTREARTGRRYDFVLRSRLDVELAHALPMAHSWARARRDVAWTLCAVPLDRALMGLGNDGVIIEMAKRHPLPPLRIQMIDFIDDNLLILPRSRQGLVEAVLGGIVQSYDTCLPRSEPPMTRGQMGCSGRWNWNECRVELALRLHALNGSWAGTKDLFINPLFGRESGGVCGSGVRFIDCVGTDGQRIDPTQAYSSPIRRARADSGTVRPVLPLLSTSVRPRNFSEAELSAYGSLSYVGNNVSRM